MSAEAVAAEYITPKLVQLVTEFVRPCGVCAECRAPRPSRCRVRRPKQARIMLQYALDSAERAITIAPPS